MTIYNDTHRLTPETITNLYLYGQETTPSDLTSESF